VEYFATALTYGSSFEDIQRPGLTWRDLQKNRQIKKTKAEEREREVMVLAAAASAAAAICI